MTAPRDSFTAGLVLLLVVAVAIAAAAAAWSRIRLRAGRRDSEVRLRDGKWVRVRDGE